MFLIECPYEGQIFMDCAPLCRKTCSTVDQTSPCPEVCVRGCGCPDGMAIDEKQRRCVMRSRCPNKGSYSHTILCIDLQFFFNLNFELVLNR